MVLKNTLQSQSAHVWRFDLSLYKDGLGAYQSTLSQEELERGGRFHFAEDQRNFFISRYLLRKILAFYAGIDPKDLQFTYSDYGKPTLRDFPWLHFNLSHTQHELLLAIANAEVGIDLESLKPHDYLEIAARYFTGDEYHALSKSATDERVQHLFYKIWTGKEAVVKVFGKGLANNLKKINVNPHLNSQQLTLDKHAIYLYSFLADKEYHGALASSTKLQFLERWNLLNDKPVREATIQLTE